MRTRPERLRRLGAAYAASRDLHAGDREALHREIEAADLEDMSVREIARLSGVSPGRVHAIVVERTAARQDRLTRPID
jgi:DNA-directed RNA polymerase specialized sigma24 family protein